MGGIQSHCRADPQNGIMNAMDGASRLPAHAPANYGALPAGLNLQAIIQCATPEPTPAAEGLSLTACFDLPDAGPWAYAAPECRTAHHAPSSPAFCDPRPDDRHIFDSGICSLQTWCIRQAAVALPATSNGACLSILRRSGTFEPRRLSTPPEHPVSS